MPTKVLTESYQGHKPKRLNKAELQRLERHYLDYMRRYASDGMYSDAGRCRCKAEVFRDLIKNYDGEEK